MKNTDKFLIGIVVGVALLVGVAFGLALVRPKPAYQADDKPEGVAHNYLLALQQQEYARAYGYLSPTLKGYPASAENFAADIQNNRWNFRLDDTSTALEVVSAAVTGEQATVTVRETSFRAGGLFDSNQSATTFYMTLRRNAENSAWQITSSDSYWAYCWDTNAGCR
jgi:hypothetical protein